MLRSKTLYEVAGVDNSVNKTSYSIVTSRVVAAEPAVKSKTQSWTSDILLGELPTGVLY